MTYSEAAAEYSLWATGSETVVSPGLSILQYNRALLATGAGAVITAGGAILKSDYALLGQGSGTVVSASAILRAARALLGTGSDVIITAGDAQLNYTRAGIYSLFATGASVVVTPQDAGVYRNYSLLAAFAAYVITGNPAMLLYGSAVIPTPTPARRIGGERAGKLIKQIPVIDGAEQQARLALVLFDFMEDE